MALISKDGKYVRVENIRVGKDLMEFAVVEYSDRTASPDSYKTIVVKYDIKGKNPFVQAYVYLLSNGYSDYSSDHEEGVRIPKMTKKKAKE